MLRFAKSPTGDMHIDTLRIALLNYLVAQQSNVHFLIRIDDLDKTSNIEGKDTEIMQILEKFALIHDTVFHQSEHLHMHQTLAIKLLEQNKAFVCSCVSDNSSCSCASKAKTEQIKLKESDTPFVLRLKKPEQDISFYDTIHGDISILSNQIDDFIILDTDGLPTSDFASACDDMLSGITHIIVPHSNLVKTAKQIHTKRLLGFDADINYTHIPTMITKDEHNTVKWLFEQGFIPDAVINYLLLLGYDKAPKKIFTMPEAIEWYKLENISNATVSFDRDKLRAINRKHLANMDDKQLSTLFGFADAEVGQLVKLYLEEASTINELALRIRPIFAPKMFEGQYADVMHTLQKIIATAPMIGSYENFINYLSQSSGLENDALLKPLRLLLTGAQSGPELSDIYPLIKSYLLEIAS